eukprot:g4546.t1
MQGDEKDVQRAVYAEGQTAAVVDIFGSIHDGDRQGQEEVLDGGRAFLFDDSRRAVGASSTDEHQDGDAGAQR